MHGRLVFLLPALIFLAWVVAACGAGDPPAANDPSRVSDEEYLKIICTGTSNFSSALVTKTRVDEIAQVVQDFETSLAKVTPPAGLDGFHKDFIKYLQGARSDPTALVTRKPPLPPDPERKRLAAKETSVAECRDVTFFNRAPASPTPG